MNSSYKPLQMPSIGGRSLRRRQWRYAVLAAVGVALGALIYLASHARVAPQAIANLQKNGVHGVYNLKAPNGELLLFNFRAIEDGKLYRASRFPRNHKGKLNGQAGLHHAAFFNSIAFDFLQAYNIRTVISLESEKETYALKGYFDSLSPQRRHRIRVISYPVPPELTYSRDTRERHGALRRAIQIIDFMKSRDDNGAVLIMGDSGKDAVGVVAAAYELWRNAGHLPGDKLWGQIKERYMVSDTLIKRDNQARKFSTPAACKDNKTTFVCPETLEALRPDLERIAQMD